MPASRSQPSRGKKLSKKKPTRPASDDAKLRAGTKTSTRTGIDTKASITARASSTERIAIFMSGTIGSHIAEMLMAFNTHAQQRGWLINLFHARERAPYIQSTQPDLVVLTIGNSPPTQPERIAMTGRGGFMAVGQDLTNFGVPSVHQDDQSIGKAAATHLVELGLRNFATFAGDGSPWALNRTTSFRQMLELRGFHDILEWRDHTDGLGEERWSYPNVGRWLKLLPKPVGILVGCDAWCQLITTACVNLNLKIPEDVCVLGVDNNELLCSLNQPPVSSVAIPWKLIGATGAELAESLLHNRIKHARSIAIPTPGVVARRSTDLLMIENPAVRAALAFIRQNAKDPIRIPDILRHVAATQHELERGFKRFVGRTMVAQIRKTRVDLAKQLLASTSMTIEQVAQQSGFAGASKLGIYFRRETGMTPRQYSRHYRMG